MNIREPYNWMYTTWHWLLDMTNHLQQPANTCFRVRPAKRQAPAENKNHTHPD